MMARKPRPLCRWNSVEMSDQRYIRMVSGGLEKKLSTTRAQVTYKLREQDESDSGMEGIKHHRYLTTRHAYGSEALKFGPELYHIQSARYFSPEVLAVRDCTYTERLL